MHSENLNNFSQIKLLICTQILSSVHTGVLLQLSTVLVSAKQTTHLENKNKIEKYGMQICVTL